MSNQRTTTVTAAVREIRIYVKADDNTPIVAKCNYQLATGTSNSLDVIARKVHAICHERKMKFDGEACVSKEISFEFPVLMERVGETWEIWFSREDGKPLSDEEEAKIVRCLES